MYPKINIKFPSESATVLTAVSALSEANVSNYTQVFTPENSVKRKAGFQLSGTVNNLFADLHGGYEFFGALGYPGYLSNGSSASTILFKLEGDIPKYLYIIFDLATGQYAPTFNVNNIGKQLTIVGQATSTIAQVGLDSLNITSGDTLSITLNSWSVPNISKKVTAITTELTIQLFGSSIISFKCSENLMNSDLSIEPGICEQYANISMYDRSKIFRERALANQLNEDIEINVIAVDNDGNEQKIGTYVSSEWNIDSNDSIIDLVCRDKSYLFEKINIQRADVADRTLDQLLNILFSQATGVSWMYADSETQTRCQNIVLPSNWYLASNLYEMLSKICSIGMLRIYWYIDTFIVGRCV